jgi:hypothetical protein
VQRKPRLTVTSSARTPEFSYSFSARIRALSTIVGGTKSSHCPCPSAVHSMHLSIRTAFPSRVAGKFPRGCLWQSKLPQPAKIVSMRFTVICFLFQKERREESSTALKKVYYSQTLRPPSPSPAPDSVEGVGNTWSIERAQSA